MSVKSKREVRAHYKELRLDMPYELKSRLDAEIAENLFALSEYQSRGTILVFISKDFEVSTESITARAFSQGKKVAAPRCDVKTKTMSFYEIESFDDLEFGCFGIPEPKKGCMRLRSFEDSICLVPALAYDVEGYRVGFGGGYYDRFLSEYSGVSVGLCYSDCVEPKLPRERHDRPVDILITDKVFRKENGYE